MTQDKKESESLEKVHRDLVSNRPSSLVKRALDDLARLKAHPPSGHEQSMDQLKKRHIGVVIGDFEGNMNDLFSELIKEVIKDKYALTIKWIDYRGELLEIAEVEVINDKYALTIRPVIYGEALLEFTENGEADILIVIVNNILFRPTYPPQERLEKSLQLITQIKKTFDKPMIVFSPLELEERVKQTGADFYFNPYDEFDDDFKMAFEKCMHEVIRRAS